jgi:GTPase
MFIDTAKIKITAGEGGNGVNSFYRDKLTRKGHPDGGDGGNGGNVIVRVSTNVHTLLDFQYRQHFKAKDGKNGSSKKQRGANGSDCVINVPPGTLVYDNETADLLADLTKDNEELILAKGGNGGKGNRSHKDATNGFKGEERAIRLELKLIADVGIIGLPNSGKSTLISKISNAHPKIAAYPFTTTAPVLGVVKLEDLEFKIAEVPGLIKDAHKGKGLGDLFLRHIERTKLLVHLVDMAQTITEAFLNYQDIDQELKLYGKGVNKKCRILAANKMDLEPAKENLELFNKKAKMRIFPISSKTGQGLDILMEEIRRQLKQLK